MTITAEPNSEPDEVSLESPEELERYLKEECKMTDADLAGLLKSFISLELAARAGLRRVTHVEGLMEFYPRGGVETVDRGKGPEFQSCAGIMFPYHFPGTESAVTPKRLRRDGPGGRKYIGRSGKGNHPYFVPFTPPEWLKDTELPIYVTEGEKKCLALWALAHHGSPERPRWLPMSLAGVDAWKTKIGGPNSEVTGPLPEFGHISWKDRSVVIVFDANVTTNTKVSRARTQLANELKRYGAKVSVVDLPALEGVNGIDDLAGVYGPERALEELVKPAAPAAKDDLLQDLCADFTYFNAGSMQDGFVQFTNEDHREVWPEERIEKVLIARFLKQTNRAPKREGLNAVMDGVKARCMTGPREEIHSRIARTPDKIYLDLCNDKWEVVEIDKDGWRLVSNPPVYFRRSNESKELPMPVSGGSLNELRPLLNAGDDDQWILMMGWLVGIFQPIGAFSHIAIEGQEGTAKTTTATNLISVVDPNEVGLCGPPKNEEDFSITAMSAGVMGFDNFSGCKASMSDMFCRCSTGMAFRTRTLYKNREVTSIKLKVPILVNGIDSVVMRGDLLRRTIVVHLPVIEKENRKAEEDLEQQYRDAHPRFLGALLDAVSAGLKNLATTKVTNPPSMASFAKWVKACESALPWESGRFLTVYHDMQLGASEELFEKDQVATVLYEWAALRIEGGRDFDINSTDLLAALNRATSGITVDKDHWPSLNSLSNYVVRAAPLLLKKGMRVERTKRTKKSKGLWHFEAMTGQRKFKVVCDREAA